MFGKLKIRGFIFNFYFYEFKLVTIVYRFQRKNDTIVKQVKKIDFFAMI